jgi:hypothetical protein
MDKKILIDGVEIPLFTDAPTPVTLSIEDIREPDKTSSSYSESIELPYTKELVVITDDIASTNSAQTNFNPNYKTPAEIIQNGVTVIKGAMKIKKIIIDPLKHDTRIVADFVGEKLNLFSNIADKFIRGNVNPSDDLDFSSYDHELNNTNVRASWVATNGSGYYYGLVDYGYKGSGVNSQDIKAFNINHLRPQLFAREVLLKIFQDAGNTWTSTFLDSAFFESIVLSCDDEIKITALAKAQRTTHAGIAGGIGSALIDTFPLTHSGGRWVSSNNFEILKINDATSSPFVDAGSQFYAPGYRIQMNASGRYIVKSVGNWSITIDNVGASNGPVTDIADFLYSMQIHVEKWNGSAWVNIGNSEILDGVGGSDNAEGSSISAFYVIELDTYLNSGDFIRTTYDVFVSNVLLKNAGGAHVVTGTTTYSVAFNNAFTAYDVFMSVEQVDLINEGDTVEVNQALPKNFKQKDFVKSIMQTFNLQLMQDKVNPNNYYIEPWGSFYTGTPIDWSSKVDGNKPFEISPVGDNDVKKYIFRFKNDGDYWNKKYSDNWQRVYGELEVDTENQFNTSDKIIEPMFSPTPLVGSTNDFSTYLYLPHVYNKDEKTDNTGFRGYDTAYVRTSTDAVKSHKSNCRLMFKGGLISGTWKFKQLSGTTTETTYPYVGTLDNPLTPTFDLNFGTPKEIYIKQYPDYTGFVGLDNIYSEYWEDFINAVTNKTSKVVRMSLILDETDINDVDFRKPVIILGTKYLLNKIENFTKKGSTIVELLTI